MSVTANGHVEIAQLLLDAGADEDLENRFGHTTFMCTGEKGHVEKAQLPLDAGADNVCVLGDGEA